MSTPNSPILVTPKIADFVELSKHRPSTREFARELDQKETTYRDQFVLPKVSTVRDPLNTTEVDENEEAAIYLAGNSLGPLPKAVVEAIEQETRVWGSHAVMGHFAHPYEHPWVKIDNAARGLSARVVGALETEVAVMGTLTGNIHLLFAGFYKPTKERFKIILEEGCFPSDHVHTPPFHCPIANQSQFAITSQISHHGLSIDDALIPLTSPANQSTIPTDLVLQTLTRHASTTSIIFLSPVSYLTGQLHDIPRITAHAHSLGILVGLDLAHAAGNVPMDLHAWGVDFAAWCSYKYLNAGPGSIAGLFVHEKHFDKTPSGFRGWWGHEDSSRFQMSPTFKPETGANSWRLSNPSVRDCVAVEASLRLFASAGGVFKLREKSVRLTAYLEHLLQVQFSEPREFQVITPEAPWRGAQLSLRMKGWDVAEVERRLMKRGVVVDTRKPDVVRVAPAPLYTRFEDVWGFVEAFREVLEEMKRERK